MTGLWEVVIPENTTNLVPNPSFEKSSTGWSAYSYGSPTGTSGARDTTWASRGRASYKFVKTGGSGGYGVQYTGISVSGLAAGTVLTFSLDVYTTTSSANMLGLFIIDVHASASNSVAISGPCRGRYSVSITLASGATTVTVGIALDTNKTGTVYVDGAQLEVKAYDTTYCDGDQEGCKWTGTPHASTSTRSAQSRAGGKIVNLDDYGFYVTELQGVGMPPLKHLVDSQALIPGSLFRGTRVQPRTFVIQGQSISTSRGGLHDRRQEILNALKPDAIGEEQPVWLRYTLDGVTIQIRTVYDTGLDFGTLQGHTETIALRLVAYDPFWYDDFGSVTVLNTSTNVADADFMLARLNGIWTAIAPNTNNAVFALAVGQNNELYAAGLFTSIGGTAANYVAKYQDGVWSALGTGLNGTAYALAVAPDGAVYVGGQFTTAGGTTVNRIAKWNGSAWLALGSTGVDDVVRSIAIAPDGVVYVGGDFHAAAGTTVNHVAKYNPVTNSWAALGSTPGTDGTVYAVTVDSNGIVYVGGQFNLAGGTTIHDMAKWDGATWSALGTLSYGSDYEVLSLALAPDNSLFAAGRFDTMYGITVNRIAQYTQSQWLALEQGFNDDVYKLSYDLKRGILYATGTFTALASGQTGFNRFAIWNGYTWVHADFLLPGVSPAPQAFAYNGDTIYMGFNTDGTAVVSGSTIVSNTGTRTAYPKIVINRAGGTSATVKYLRNETLNVTIWLNYALLDGETLTIDFTPGARTITSSFFGTVWRAVLPGSDIGKFALLPGDNTILTYVETAGSPTIDAYMGWRNVHWSIDGVGV